MSNVVKEFFFLIRVYTKLIIRDSTASIELIAKSYFSYFLIYIFLNINHDLSFFSLIYNRLFWMLYLGVSGVLIKDHCVGW